MKSIRLALLLVLGFLVQPLQASPEPTTWHEYRFRNMVEQKLDMSCGAASMSALMTYYGDAPTGEAELLELLAQVVGATEQDAVLSDGFSLLHLKKAVATKGLVLKAANIDTAQLVGFGSPALLQLKTRQGNHFVLWHGQLKGRHWLGDPSRGDLWLSDNELKQEWTGIAAWLFQGGEPLPQGTKEQLDAAYERR